MEWLTVERGERAWKLFHIGGYINMALVVAMLLTAWYFFAGVISGVYGAGEENSSVDLMMTMSFLGLAAILLMGAGISRYQARIEGQHLELKLAIRQVAEDLAALRTALESTRLRVS